MSVFFKLAGIACVSFVIVGCAAALVQFFYIEHVTNAERAWESSRIYGVDVYPQNITILSVNTLTNVITAQVESNTTQRNITVQLHPTDSFFIERRDPLFNAAGDMVGTSPLRTLTVSDVRPGDRGIAVVKIQAQSGIMYIQYLLVGTPFPRP